jgi:hypothetical protein
MKKPTTVLAALWVVASACRSIAPGAEPAPAPHSPPRPTAAAPPIADATNNSTVDLASEFLATACRTAPGPDFARAWLAYEDRHRRFYDAMYYESQEARDARSKLAEELGPRRDEMCGHVRAFLLSAPGTLAMLRPRVAELLGQVPRAPVYFAVALQWTDGRAAVLDGQKILVLNARHQEFSSTGGLAMLVAHELIHDAQSSARVPGEEPLSPLANALYSEGGAVFGVQLLFPEAPERAYTMRPDYQVERAAMMTPLAARDLLAELRAADARLALRRFFEGGYPDVVLPPRSGYYVGCEIYRSFSQRIGAAAAVRTSPAAFLAHAEVQLRAMSQLSLEAVAPSVEIESLNQLRSAFIEKAACSGLTLPFLPSLREQTGRSFARDLEATHALWLQRWEDTNPALRELLVRISGDSAGARRLFDALFRWVAVPHQMAHAFQNTPSEVHDRAATERLATDAAVAFLRDLPGARRPLLALAPLLLEVKDKLPSLPSFQSDDELDRHFNRDHDAIDRDPGLYLAYRVHFMLESYRRLHRIDFKHTLQSMARPSGTTAVPDNIRHKC